MYSGCWYPLYSGLNVLLCLCSELGASCISVTLLLKEDCLVYTSNSNTLWHRRTYFNGTLVHITYFECKITRYIRTIKFFYFLDIL